MMPRRYWMVVGTFLLSVLLYVDRACISSAKDAVTQDLNLTDTQFGWALSAFALGYALFQTPSGALADRFGPRRLLAGVVSLWSLFTGFTGMVQGLGALVAVRFLFGAGEAGAFPGMARAAYAWIPPQERGLVQGINFSGSRLGAAFAMPLIAVMVQSLGWRATFQVLMGVGFLWAIAWYAFFRDEPGGEAAAPSGRPAAISGGNVASLLALPGLGRAMGQYFCSNFTFFFTLTWLYPYLKSTYRLDAVQAGWYALAPFLAGAVGNVVAGALVDRLYRSGHLSLSRRLPAMIGFTLAAAGLLGSVVAGSAPAAVAWLSLAIFGADMTLAPSWALCMDIGRERSGAVSGTMNMAGNLGSFVTSLAFPYLLAWTGTPTVFFYVGAALNLFAVGLWLGMRPASAPEVFA